MYRRLLMFVVLIEDRKVETLVPNYGGPASCCSGRSAFRVKVGREPRLDFAGDLRSVLVEHEVSAIEPDQLCFAQIVQVGAGSRRDEERIVLAPDDQGLRL